MSPTPQSQPAHDVPANLCKSCARNVPLQDDNKHGTRQHGHISWNDTCPDYPSLKASSQGGCDMCSILRNALLRRNIPYEGRVKIKGHYCYTFHRHNEDYVHTVELAYFQCRLTGNEGRELGAIMFSMTSGDRQICEWLGTNGYYRTHPLHQDNIKGLKKLLNSSAPRYKQLPTDFKPTRLIHVGSDDGPMPRLILTASSLAHDPGLRLDYACLSYCWGQQEAAERQLTTTRSNLNAHCQGIDIGQMPRVVLDTILTCRALGIDYVWIDALCIIQGDHDDWIRESATMGSVYFYSHLTICPLAPRSCIEGFLEPREMGVEIPFRSLQRPNIQGHYRLRESYNDTDGEPLEIIPREDEFILGKYPRPFTLEKILSTWAKRGWTLQEEMCSRRILYFGRERLYYVCRETSFAVSEDICNDPQLLSFMIASEHTWYRFMRAARSTEEAERVLIESDAQNDSEGVSDAEDTEWRAPRPRGTSMDTRIDAADDHELCLLVLECWHISTLEVCSRALTNRQDLFPSIAGFAESCAAILNDTYLAGMWKSFIHFGLIWQVMQPSTGTLDSILTAESPSHGPFIAPSWSWASQGRPIKYCAEVGLAKPNRWKRQTNGSRAVTNDDKEDEDFLRNKFQSRSILEASTVCLNQLRSVVTTRDYRIATESTYAFGRLTGASIKLLAKVVPLQHGIFMYPGADRKTFQEGPPLFGRKGDLYPDWDSEKTSLEKCDGLSLLLTAVSCLETSQAYKEMFEPGNVFKAGPLVDYPFMPSRCTTLCRWCLDDTHYGHHYGIVIHPTKADPSRYHRVGAFVLYGGFDGGRIFDNVLPTEITLV